jgi:hypothetical protein
VLNLHGQKTRSVFNAQPPDFRLVETMRLTASLVDHDDAVDTFCDMSKQYDMMKAIRTFSDLAYAAQSAGVSPLQIIGVQSKNDLPQIKFIKDYKPELEKIMKAMDTFIYVLLDQLLCYDTCSLCSVEPFLGQCKLHLLASIFFF